MSYCINTDECTSLQRRKLLKSISNVTKVEHLSALGMVLEHPSDSMWIFLILFSSDVSSRKPRLGKSVKSHKHSICDLHFEGKNIPHGLQNTI